MSRRATVLVDITCACGQSFEWLAREGDPLPSTCSAGCHEAEERRRAGTLCLRCGTEPRRWRGLCLGCFWPARLEAIRRGGWGALVAEGTAAPRSPGHGNPESRPCSEPGCDRKATCKGICKLHRDRQRRREKFNSRQGAS